jgi:hypothetical protein
VRDGEYLDIDWDFFAGILHPASDIPMRVDKFLAGEFHFIPDQIYVSYSPEFSHQSRDLFQRFIADLAQIFDGQVFELQPRQDQPLVQPFYRKYLPNPMFRLARKIYYKTNLGLRSWGVY